MDDPAAAVIVIDRMDNERGFQTHLASGSPAIIVGMFVGQSQQHRVFEYQRRPFERNAILDFLALAFGVHPNAISFITTHP